MSVAQLTEWRAQVKSEYAAFGAFQKHADEAKRALGAKKPFEHSKQLLAELPKLGALTKRLHDIAGKGLGQPEKKLEDSGELFRLKMQMQLSDKDKDHVTKEYLAARASMAGLTGRGEELAEELNDIGRSASSRRMLSLHFREDFGKLMKAVTDNKMKGQLFENVEAFAAAEGGLGGVHQAAEHAAKKIEEGIGEMRKKIEQLVKWFEEAVKEAEKAKKK